ncbi:6-hydroxymethylpterin diphosphokinase MptE-like protein [Chloroflexota bacterium]
MLEKIAEYAPQALRENKICRSLWRKFIYCIRLGPRMYIKCNYGRHSSKLKKFKDIHKGQRGFIIGSGPSIEQTNLSLLKDEIIFGVNSLYAGLTKFGITCDYYAVSDGIMWRNHFKGILSVDTTLFLGGWAGRKYLEDLGLFRKYERRKPTVVRQLGWIHDSNGNFYFSKDMSKGAYEGSTVIIDMCLQMAYYMGFKEVYLLGCDCDFSGSLHFDGAPAVSEDKIARLKPTDPGYLRSTNDWSRIFAAYEKCKKVYEEDGREIINATVGGKLEVFKRKRLEEVIGE